MPLARVRFPTLLLVILVLLTPPAAPMLVQAQESAPARNIRGIHTLAASRQAIDDQLTWASTLVGAGGYVTQPFLGINADTVGPSADAVYFVEQAYARNLDPILVLQGQFVNRDGCNSTGYVGWLPPTPDEDGASYQREAGGYARFVAGLPRTDGRTLYVQVANEPNLHEMWGRVASPAQYARFFVDVSAAIRALGDARVRILNAALAPEGNVDNLQFIGGAIMADPRFVTSFDDWATHPYPRNRPPSSNLHDGTAGPDSRYAIDSYRLELAALRAHGVETDGLSVILTETGYELGDSYYGEFPPMSEELRAAYIREALTEHWPRWPEVKAVTPFQLSGWYGSWRTFDWVHPSSETTQHGFPTQPRLQYANLLPGVGTVAGVALDDRGVPLADVEIVAQPGGYRSTTLADGSFLLLAQPGTYALTGEKDGYASAAYPSVTVTAGQQAPAVLALPAQPSDSLRNADFEGGDLTAWTRWGDVDGVQTGPWFFDTSAPPGASAGAHFLGTAVNCGAKDGGVYQMAGAQPGASVTASAWALTYRDGPAAIGSRIGIDPTGGLDPRADRIVWSERQETGSIWQQFTVTTPAAADRVTVFLEHDQDAANPWNVSAWDAVTLVQARS
jgi:hypothetical protein